MPNLTMAASVVASVLRDEYVDQVVQENKQLTEAESKAARIEITGPKGVVYAFGDIREGSPGGKGEMWTAPLAKLQHCPLSDVDSIQVSLGGVPLLTPGSVGDWQCAVLHFLSRSCEDNNFGLLEFWPLTRGLSSSISSISVRASPFQSFAQYADLSDGHDRDYPYQAYHLSSFGEHHPKMTARFEEMSFKLPDMLSCLERFGISKEQATKVDSHWENGLGSVSLAQEDQHAQDQQLDSTQGQANEIAIREGMSIMNQQAMALAPVFPMICMPIDSAMICNQLMMGNPMIGYPSVMMGYQPMIMGSNLNQGTMAGLSSQRLGNPLLGVNTMRFQRPSQPRRRLEDTLLDNGDFQSPHHSRKRLRSSNKPRDPPTTP